MRPRSPRLSIIIPTKNRAWILSELLESITRTEEVEEICPEVIVADNNSDDDTRDVVASAAKNFATELRVLGVATPGKSAALNGAVKSAAGDLIAFLDDDVIVDKTWLTAVSGFFRCGEYQAAQGLIGLQAPAKDDPEILKLVERYRTIPKLNYEPDLKTVHSLNGANFFVARDVFERVGGFDERLGPGASGTSEDVDFARRLARANVAIGYAPEAIVYHRVDRDRLTEEYFKQSHKRQGVSRFVMRRRGAAAIAFDLARATAQYAYHSATGTERSRYRSKGRIYHYIGMMQAMHNHRR